MSTNTAIPSSRSPGRLHGLVTVIAAALASTAILATAGPALSQSKPAEQLGVSTGLAVPRFVSLKSATVRMRRGPSREHNVLWTYKKAGLPVEITAEFENWRKVRDWEGSEGWIFHTLLSGRRTIMVAPWKKKGLIGIFKKPSANAPLAARIGPKVVAKVQNCNRVWCRISGKGYEGYIQQKSLWGVYPNEKLN